MELETTLTLRENTINKLLDNMKIVSTDTEQYSIRSHHRINGIEWDQKRREGRGCN